MMVIDSSALVAIMDDEPERSTFNEKIVATGSCLISAATLLEVRIVLLSRFGEEGIIALDSFLFKSGIEIVDVTARTGDLAFDAYRRFGKGTGHPANLNYGDCFAYALAKEMGIPLLYKGDDFSQTDISNPFEV